jgi:hypothetical protein
MQKQNDILQRLSFVRQSFSVGNIFRLGIILVAMWFVYFSIATIFMPYPIEYREGVSQVLTQLLLNGENPFSAANQPLAMTNYGILYSFVAYPFVVLFGNTLAVYRSINFIILLFIFLIISQTAYKNGSDRYIALACGLMIVIVVPSWGGYGAYPSIMGTFLFISAALIPFRFSFSIKSLWISAFLSVLAYYTKPYFVLSFGVVLSYIFLFISKRKGLLYGLIFGLIFISFYLPVRSVFDFYFINTFWGNVANASRSFDHMRKQLIELVKEFAPVIGLMAWIVIGDFRNIQRVVFSKTTRFQFNIRNFNEPLFLSPLNYFLFWGLCSVLAFVFVLGVHDGAYMTYAYHLMLTPLLFWFAQRADLKVYKDKIVMPLILLNVITLSFTFLNINFLSQRNSPEWAELYSYVSDSTSILNSPVIVSAMIERNKMPVDSGQTEYYYFIRDPYPQSKLLGPEYSVFQMRGEEYKESISQLIKEKHYDKLLLTKGQYQDNEFFPDISRNYILVNEITVPMPQVNQNWTIEIWEPIK